MKGDTHIIEALNTLLASELTAMDQYLIHAKMYQDWGLKKLYERIHHEFDDEKQHAEKLIERILFLEGIPNMKDRDDVQIGQDVPSMLQNDLNVEYAVDKKLKQAIGLCEQKQDYVSRDILVELLDDTEMDHAYWLEQQLNQIKLIGLENYIQSQL